MVQPQPAQLTSTPPHGTFPMTRLQKIIRAAFHNRALGQARIRRPFVRLFREASAEPVDATLFGLKVRFHPRDNQTDEKGAVCGTAYNRKELRWLYRGLRRGDVFLDIGANMGFFSLFAATRGARVIAIEPNPVLQARLLANFAFNGLDITLIPGAVGDLHQRVEMLHRNEDLGSSSIRPSVTARIEMRPLLDYVRAITLTRIDVLKIDIKGYEDRALLPFLRDAPAFLLPHLIIMEHATEPSRRQALHQGLIASGLYRQRERTRANALLERIDGAPAAGGRLTDPSYKIPA